MTGVVARLMIAVMAVVAVLHALWALGLWWPLGDEAALAHAVLGTPGVDTMPGAALTWAVVAMVLAGITLIAALAGWITLPLPGWLVRLAGWTMAAILILRGAGSYVARLAGAAMEEPFGQLDALAYSPLILALGLGTLFLMRR